MKKLSTIVCALSVSVFLFSGCVLVDGWNDLTKGAKDSYDRTTKAVDEAKQKVDETVKDAQAAIDSAKKAKEDVDKAMNSIDKAKEDFGKISQ